MYRRRGAVQQSHSTDVFVWSFLYNSTVCFQFFVQFKALTFLGRMWNSTVSDPGHCYFINFTHPIVSLVVNIEVNIWATSWQNQQCGCAPSEDSDQPGHPPSLIRVSAVRMKKAWVLSYPLSAQRILWSESSLGAQSFCWFCHEAAQFSVYIFCPAFLCTLQVLKWLVLVFERDCRGIFPSIFHSWFRYIPGQKIMIPTSTQLTGYLVNTKQKHDFWCIKQKFIYKMRKNVFAQIFLFKSYVAIYAWMVLNGSSQCACADEIFTLKIKIIIYRPRITL